MIEFLIQPTNDDFFDSYHDRDDQVLRPISTPSKPIAGRGYGIEALGCEIDFSDEMAGIQVSFVRGDISEENAERLVEEIRQNIEKETGQQAHCFMLTGNS